MKRKTLVCLFIVVCFFHLSIPKVVFGQQSTPVENVFKKYEETFKHPDIQKFFPPVLRAFQKDEIQTVLNPHVIIQFVVEPSYIRSFYPDAVDSILIFLAIDLEFQALFKDGDFHKVLQNPTAIEELAVLIENLQIPMLLEKVTGDDQTGNTDTSLLDPFIVVVKDQKDNPIAGISVTFRLISGDGKFSDLTPTTDSNGQATTTFTLGLTAGISLIEASVDGISDKPIFTATATTLVVSITPSKIVSPAENKQFTLNVNIAGGQNITGYEFTVEYDPTALCYVETPEPKFNGDFLPVAYSIKEIVTKKTGTPEEDEEVEKKMVTLAAVSPFADSSGDGVLATLTFEVIAVKESVLILAEGNLSNSDGVLLPPLLENAQIVMLNVDVNGDGKVDILDMMKVGSNFGNSGEGDVNGDGVVNILDLISVVQAMGTSEAEGPIYFPADVNGDGIVNILDLVKVASSFGETASAPSVHALTQARISAADVQTWLIQAKTLDLNIPETTKANPAYQRGVAVLENLLATLTQTETVSKKTALLLNYPNPFNPETWIPYQLAEAADVTVTIHSINGRLIRTLALGHQAAGLYRSKNRAAYWDGRNQFGEKAASGLYFYTFTAGKFSATGKMLIRK